MLEKDIYLGLVGDDLVLVPAFSRAGADKLIEPHNGKIQRMIYNGSSNGYNT